MAVCVCAIRQYCNHAGGGRSYRWKGKMQCQRCVGYGYSNPCPTCGGAGLLLGVKCPSCFGCGYVADKTPRAPVKEARA